MWYRCCLSNIYSVLIADNALSFIALFAGKYPAAIPINVANIKEVPHSQKGIEESILLFVLKANTLTILDAPKLSNIPASPPANPINAASVKNNFLIIL